METRVLRRLLSVTSATLLCGISHGALAQSAPAAPAPQASDSANTQDNGDRSDDIVVTARKRDERLSDVPMSITAASGDQLANQGVRTVADLSKITPALTVSTTYANTPIYTIRGIGFFENSIAVAPAVSIYTDQIPLPFSVMTEGAPLDVQRVEVLKGPQGTLFGQNATGGAINYVPNLPTDKFEAGAKFSYGNYNAVDANGYVSGPLSDTLGIRISGALQRRDAWQKSVSRPTDRLGRQDAGQGRILLAWKPTSGLKFVLNVNGWYNRGESTAGQFMAAKPTVPVPPGYAPAWDAVKNLTPTPNDPRLADWTPGKDYGRRDSFFQAALRADWEIGSGISLTSITSYEKYKRKSLSDPDGVPSQNSSIDQTGNVESFYQELRLAGSTFGDQLKWMIGANYAKDKAHEGTDANNIGTNSLIAGMFIDGVYQIANNDIKTKAIFGSLEYNLTQSLSVQGSIRYTDSDNDFSGCAADRGNGYVAGVFSILTGTTILPGQCVTLGATRQPSLTPVPRTLDEDNLSWKVGLSWKPKSGTMLYANVTRGYKAGSFAILPAVSITQLIPVPQESIMSYEVGVKTQLTRGVDLTVAAFRYDYDNKQLRGYIPVPPFGNLPGLVTIPKSRVNGAEASLLIRPTAGLTFNLGASYIDSKVTRSYVIQNADAQRVDILGGAFPFTPKWQLTGDVQYEFRLSNNVRAFVGAGARYQSRSVASFGDNSTYDIPGYGLLDLRAGLTGPDNRWRFELWGRNVTNTFYLDNVLHVVDTQVRYVGMPATYGASVSFKF